MVDLSRLPLKEDWVSREVFSASNLNDITHTINELGSWSEGLINDSASGSSASTYSAQKIESLVTSAVTVTGVKSGETILSLSGTELTSTISIDYVSSAKTIYLKGINDEVISSIDASDFVKDGMLISTGIYKKSSTRWTPSTPTGGTVPTQNGTYIRFEWNTDAGSAHTIDYLNVTTLVDEYEAGYGLQLSGQTFSIKIDPTPGNVILSATSAGLKASVEIPELVKPTISKTYAELYAMCTGGTLTPGQTYRITDYQCTTTQTDTQSAGHSFDIIVTADNETTLNEVARATHHSGDTYFEDSDLAAWELKYTIYNDSDRFSWADTATGKGVIYWMKDEWENEAPYDFKNIQFKRYKRKYYGDEYEDAGISGLTEDTEDWTGLTGYHVVLPENLSGSGLTKMKEAVYNYLNYNGYQDYFPTQEQTSDAPFDWQYFTSGETRTLGKVSIVLNGTKYDTELKAESTSTSKWFYTFSNRNGEDVSDDMVIYDGSVASEDVSTDVSQNNKLNLGSTKSYSLPNIVFFMSDASSVYDNKFEGISYNMNFGSDCYLNSFGNECYNNSFGNSCYSNSFGNNCQYNIFGNECQYNSFGNEHHRSSFGNNCQYNSFGNSCGYNSFGNDCGSNSFGNDCGSNSFGNDCYSNSFGNSCGSNSFENDCYSNSFGNYYYLNSFGNECQCNSFGNNCYSNSFGNNCQYNIFGNECGSNNFGNEYYYNSFGNYSQYNSFGNSCGSNSFGNECYYNSFGNECQNNSFGNSCGSNSFGNEFSKNTLGIDIHYLDFTVNYPGTGASEAGVTCIQILNGYKYSQLTAVPTGIVTGATYCQYVGYTSTGTFVVVNPLEGFV